MPKMQEDLRGRQLFMRIMPRFHELLGSAMALTGSARVLDGGHEPRQQRGTMLRSACG